MCFHCFALMQSRQRNAAAKANKRGSVVERYGSQGSVCSPLLFGLIHDNSFSVETLTFVYLINWKDLELHFLTCCLSSSSSAVSETDANSTPIAVSEYDHGQFRTCVTSLSTLVTEDSLYFVVQRASNGANVRTTFCCRPSQSSQSVLRARR